MSNRRKDEGEEELQLQLLEVTQDPTFGKPAQQHNRLLVVRGESESDTPDDMNPPTVKVLH